MDLLTSRIVVRGVSYEVRELSAEEYAGVRKLTAKNETHRIEAWSVSLACIEPKLGTETEVMKLPQLLVDKLSTEIFRLTKGQPEKKASPTESSSSTDLPVS